MLLTLSIRLKLIIGFALVIATLSGSYLINGLVTFEQLYELQRSSSARNLEEVVRGRMDDRIRATELAIVQILSNREAVEAFANRDRESLRRIFLPSWESIQSMGISQFQFHLPDSHSFFRVHKPEKFGDDLSSFRMTVNEANQKKTTIRGLEEGRAGFGFRVVLPVADRGQHLGTVEFGLDFGKDFIDELKRDFGGEYFIFRFNEEPAVAWKKGKGQAFLAGTLPEDPAPELDAFNHPALREGKMVYESISGDLLAILIPFHDFSGNQKGYIKAFVGTKEVERARMAGFIVSIAITGSALLGAALFTWLLVRLLMGPIVETTEFAGKVSSGDLTVHINSHAQDEIGQMTESLRHMKDSLVFLISQLSASASQATMVSKTVSASSSEIMLATRQVSQTMETVASGATNLSENARFAHEAADLMIRSSNGVEDAAARGVKEAADVSEASRVAGEAARQAEEIINQLRTIMEKTALSVDTLGNRLSGIGEITGVINSISEEINLLSLNASIEAARAGEAGRGFAVVADHVSKLADQSRKATSDINVAIGEIMASAGQTVEMIKSGNRDVSQGAEGIHAALSAMEQIEGRIRTVSGVIDDISSSAEDQKAKSGVVLQAVESVSTIAEDTAASVEEVAATVEQISGLMDGLTLTATDLRDVALAIEKEVSKFKLPSV